MNLKKSSAGLFLSVLLTACAAKPDHFYTLNVLPETARGALASPVVHVLLDVNVPVLVDRAEMVINTSQNGVLILDHHRWAPPLSDQISQTLARDLEQRRGDILIGDRGFDQAASPPVALKIDIVRMSVQRGGRASIEAHWRIVDASAGIDEIGSDVFTAPVAGGSYASIARGYSEALSELADRLVATLQRK